MSEQSPAGEFDCSLFRYVPNILSGEFLNIGLVMWGLADDAHAFSGLRFRQDWSRILQFDPDADVEVLAAMCTEISVLIEETSDRGLVRRKLENSLSNIVQLSDRWTVRAEDPAREMEKLANLYFGSAQPAPQKTLPYLHERVPVYRERKLIALPLWGTVAAGQPIEAVQVPETISLEDVVGRKNVFALRVRGDSMQDEHIVDGDYVLLEKTKKAHNGDIVVALIDGYDTTLKRFYLQGETVRLQPSNVTMPPIVVAAEAVQIQGKVIGVLRKY
jgi:SOS regulatory protein LexA